MKEYLSRKMMPWSIRRSVLVYAPFTLIQTCALLLGFRRIRSSADRPLAITFSVSEDYARLWLWHAKRALPARDWDFAVVDCTGRMDARHFAGADLIPFMNFPHGMKIDMFMRHIIPARTVFLCDDDTYCMRPLDVPRALLALPRTAVVSLRPRVAYRIRHGGEDHLPMGTYALLMNRETLVRENIRFRSPRGNSHRRIFNRPAGFKNGLSFDTGDYANERILELGYAVRHGEAGDVRGFTALTQPRLLLECYGKERIKRMILATDRFRVGGAGTTLTSLYAMHSFESLFTKIFKEDPSFSCNYTAPELRAMAEAATVPFEERDDVLRTFSEIDILLADLRASAAQS